VADSPATGASEDPFGDATGDVIDALATVIGEVSDVLQITAGVTSVEASDALALVASEGSEDENVPIPVDIPGAGWNPYVREQFMPTVAREGERRRKDRWWRGWR
jgi:hypothetical protein